MDTSQNHVKWGCLGLALCVGLWSGCNRSPYKLVPGSGVVTIDDRPLPGASVNYQPIGKTTRDPGPGSFGITDQQGRYTLELVDPARPGVIAGEHRVTITTAGQSADAASDELNRGDFNKLPPYCSDGSIRITVPESGSDTLDIQIELRGTRPRR